MTLKNILKFIAIIWITLVPLTVSAAQFEATGYDLTSSYTGLTATGFDLNNKDWAAARTVATDPDIIPMGTRMKIVFPGVWSYMTGIYTARDTGSAIKGYIIDVYFGYTSGAHQNAIWFGRRNVQITFL